MRTFAAAIALLAFAPALAGEGPPAGATPVGLRPGERRDLCASKLAATCPVTRFICDDPKVATVELGEPGRAATLLGVGTGRTLCAVYGFEGTGRRLLWVTVEPAAGK